MQPPEQEALSSKLIYFSRPQHAVFDDKIYQSFYKHFKVHVKRPEGRTWGPSRRLFVHHGLPVRTKGLEDTVGLTRPSRTVLSATPSHVCTLPWYTDLLSWGGSGCRTVHSAACTLGLVKNKDEYRDALRETSHFMIVPRLRYFFVLLCNMGGLAAGLWAILGTFLVKTT